MHNFRTINCDVMTTNGGDNKVILLLINDAGRFVKCKYIKTCECNSPFHFKPHLRSSLRLPSDFTSSRSSERRIKIENNEMQPHYEEVYRAGGDRRSLFIPRPI